MSRPRPPRTPHEGRSESIFLALEQRLIDELGYDGPPKGLQGAGALLRVFRATFRNDLEHWFPLIPPKGSARQGGGWDESGLDLADLRELYRALRVVWLAELVFGCTERAQAWLRQPKRRLLGRVPLRLCQYGRHAVVIEQWLACIDEGKEP